MRRLLSIILLSFIFSVPVLANGAKIYTRKAKLEDFTSTTLRVFLNGSPALNAALSEEIAARWDLSPYEFIGERDYQKSITSNSYYFLLIESREGIDFLSLKKGGNEKDENMLKRPFEVVSIPICGTGGPEKQAILYLPAYIDLIQKFVRGAINSDGQAYSGLSKFNFSNLNGKEACLEDEQSEIWFKKEEPGTVIGIIVAPVSGGKDKVYYKMLLSTDSHELFYFRSHKLKDGETPGWSKADRFRIYGRID